MMPGLHGPLDRLNERVGGGRLEDRVAEREVDDVDAEAAAVGDRELDGADDVAGAAAALGVQHLQRDEADARGDAPHRAIHRRLLRAHQSGHMRAVTVGVGGRRAPRAATGEVDECLDAAREGR